MSLPLRTFGNLEDFLGGLVQVGLGLGVDYAHIDIRPKAKTYSSPPTHFKFSPKRTHMADAGALHLGDRGEVGRILIVITERGEKVVSQV